MRQLAKYLCECGSADLTDSGTGLCDACEVSLSPVCPVCEEEYENFNKEYDMCDICFKEHVEEQD